MLNNNYKKIRHIPHFHLIRSVESRLLSEYIDKKNGPFLDLGCGDGNFSAILELDDVCGLDIDEKSVIAEAEKGFYKKTVHGNAAKMPFSDATFGTVFSNCAIEHMNGLNNVLKEVGRILKKRGKFCFTAPSKGFLEALKNDKILGAISLNGNDKIAEYNKFHHHVNILDLDEWGKMLDRTGFKLIRHEYYLPGKIGIFVARMDMLYTVNGPGSKELLREQERQYKSIFGLPFRRQCKRYIENPHSDKTGTHLIIEVEKS